ncbi:YjjG family noncanonical pyrimidine nucleotidase [Nonlabens ponticola]|uniref:Noncanonical pyrimidine nucleotidase, YjjG family n=1 Tax=Nonlabens ponticola TaxID=2496866 RepID=A0A3S9N0T0_9FLAO|nr:YjjG family noncanonical pyrimidine nucleotidase [Nonlabens ponticola]AZQ45017.1 noncanonical pyrimidine nucleotidase, YjjG family [Nonlabens ponticola]
MSDFKNIEHIFFDLDHTLWDFDRNSKLTYAGIFKEENLDIDIEKFVQIYIPLNLKFWKMYRHNEISKEELRFQRLKTAFDSYGIEVDKVQIDHIADQYILKLPEHNHLFEGCLELLDGLKDRYQIHLITNGFDEVQEYKITNAGLKKYFAYMLTAETAGVKKPDLKIFEQAMKDTGATPFNSLMVGDSLEADVEGALAAGMQAVWFDPDKIDANYNGYRVERLSQIQELLS